MASMALPRFMTSFRYFHRMIPSGLDPARVVDYGDLERRRLPGRLEAQAPLSDGLVVRTPGDEHHVMTVLGEPSADHAPDGSRSVDDESHAGKAPTPVHARARPGGYDRRMHPDPRTVLDRLQAAHGPLDPPPRRDPLDELVLTILSQNTSDVNRDRAWHRLCARFSSWDAVADAPRAEVIEAIREGGLANQKAPRIQAILRAIREQRGDIDLGFLRRRTDASVDAFLQDLPGVGPKTAACVLAFSLGRPALPVDTHVHRLAHRLGLLEPNVNAAGAHEALRRLVSPADRLPLHVALIRHGRAVCRARRPACEDCVLASLCPRVGV